MGTEGPPSIIALIDRLGRGASGGGGAAARPTTGRRRDIATIIATAVIAVIVIVIVIVIAVASAYIITSTIAITIAIKTIYQGRGRCWLQRLHASLQQQYPKNSTKNNTFIYDLFM